MHCHLFHNFIGHGTLGSCLTVLIQQSVGLSLALKKQGNINMWLSIVFCICIMLNSRIEEDKCIKFLKEIRFYLLLPEAIYDVKLHSLGIHRKVKLSLNFKLGVPSLAFMCQYL